MKPFKRIILSGLLILPVIPTQTHAQDWVDESNQHTQVVLEAQSRFVPEAASNLGLDEFDSMILDIGPRLYERSSAVDRELVDLTLERLRTAEHPKVIQDLQILQQALEDGIRSAQLEHQYMLPYYNLSQTLFFGFRSLLDPRTDSARYPAAPWRFTPTARSTYIPTHRT